MPVNQIVTYEIECDACFEKFRAWGDVQIEDCDFEKAKEFAEEIGWNFSSHEVLCPQCWANGERFE